MAERDVTVATSVPAPAGRSATLLRRTQIAKLGLAALLLTWLIVSGRLRPQVVAELQLGPALLAALVCKALMIALPAARWTLLVRAKGLYLPLGATVHIAAVGHGFSLIGPSSIGRDGARLFYGIKLNPGCGPLIASTILLDTVIGFCALVGVAIAGGLAFAASQPDAAITHWVLVIVSALAGGLLAVLVAWNQRRRAAVLARRLPLLQPFLSAIEDCRYSGGVLAVSVALSALGHLAGIVAAYFVFTSMSLAPPLALLAALTPMIDISRGLPLTPFGFGVADSLAHVLYGAAGNQAGAEASVVLGLLSALLSLVGLVAWLRPLRMEPRSANTSPSLDTTSCA
jgi:uncharacterized protein (TIRG00374 family)